MTRNQFRLFFLTLIALSLIIGPIDRRLIPDQAKAFASRELPPLTTSPRLQLALDSVVVISGLASVIGVLLFRSWGRFAFIFFQVAAFSTTPMSRLLVITSGWGMTLIYFDALLTGVFITLCFVRPISDYFRARSRQTPNQALQPTAGRSDQ